MKRFIALLVLAGLVGIGTWFFMRPPAIAPQVVFSTLSGQQLSTDQLRGKVVLVKFWATSCVTCIAQMPETIETYNKYHAQGFETIAVAMQYDPANYVINYTETKKLPFTVALDTRGTVAKAFGDIRLTPTSFLIDRQGAVIKRYLGDYDVNDFHRALEKALSAQPT
jgi:peroxiredoxin